MSDSNYCKDCHSRDCQCFPDYESPVNELDRLRRENPKLKARVAELEAEVSRMKVQNEWHDEAPDSSGWYWVRQKLASGFGSPRVVFIDELNVIGIGGLPVRKNRFQGWQWREAR